MPKKPSKPRPRPTGPKKPAYRAASWKLAQRWMYIPAAFACVVLLLALTACATTQGRSDTKAAAVCAGNAALDGAVSELEGFVRALLAQEDWRARLDRVLGSLARDAATCTLDKIGNEPVATALAGPSVPDVAGRARSYMADRGLRVGP